MDSVSNIRHDSGGGNEQFGSCYMKNNHKNKRNNDEFKFHPKNICT